jgi:hypothetical protein
VSPEPATTDVAALAWRDDKTFEIAGVTFQASAVDRFRLPRGSFWLVKPRPMVERYRALLSSLQPRRILELGIYQGGSAAFFALLCRPERLVAVDISDDPAVGLERFIDERCLRDRVRTHYSLDQADVSALHRLVADEFGGEPLDLVVDDASHQLGPTRSSFNALFPICARVGSSSSRTGPGTINSTRGSRPEPTGTTSCGRSSPNTRCSARPRPR